MSWHIVTAAPVGRALIVFFVHLSINEFHFFFPVNSCRPDQFCQLWIETVFTSGASAHTTTRCEYFKSKDYPVQMLVMLFCPLNPFFSLKRRKKIGAHCEYCVSFVSLLLVWMATSPPLCITHSGFLFKTQRGWWNQLHTWKASL